MTGSQVYQLRSLARGPIPFDVYRKWDQRPLRGLFIRRAFTFDSALNISITEVGWNLYKETTHAKYRNDWTRPVFKHRQLRMIERRA